MKKTALFAVMLLAMISVKAQKYGYVDTDYILSKIPAYEAAQQQLDDQSALWQEELELKYKDLDNMYKDYQSNKVLLSDDMKIKKEDEIIDAEKQIKELQKQYFGPEGDLYQKRTELIEPIQNSINDALQKLAADGGYAFIFDVSSGGAIILFTDPKYDISDQVLAKMGY